MARERYIWARKAAWHGAARGLKLAMLYYIVLSLISSGPVGILFVFYPPVLLLGMICIGVSAMIGALTGMLLSLTLSRSATDPLVTAHGVGAVIISSGLAIILSAVALVFLSATFEDADTRAGALLIYLVLVGVPSVIYWIAALDFTDRLPDLLWRPGYLRSSSDAELEETP
jgi:hypothetical protein